jgi:spore maturation protein CgeB
LSSDPKLSFALCADVGPSHLGLHFLKAAQKTDMSVSLLDRREAYEGNFLLRHIKWRLMNRRPVGLESFSRKTAEFFRNQKHDFLFATGLAPLTAEALSQIRDTGVKRAVYLTDDPFNPVHGSRWFFKALPLYDLVFTGRRANMEDLKRAGCARVEYLPFGYAPEIHFPEAPSEAEKDKYDCDVSFVGGADKDRIPYLAALIAGGLKVKVYGGYWNRYAATRDAWQGFVLDSELRKSVSGSKACLCLVRRANRDGHVMRTFELAAMGACILAEDTEEHREIYGGPEEGTVEYFTDIPDLVEKTRALSNDPQRREAMRKKVHERITQGANTYEDRLGTILDGLKSLKKKNP